MANLKYAVAAVAALAPSVLASFNIHNYCDVDVTVVYSKDASCDMGKDGTCGSEPWTLASGEIQNFDWIPGGASVSMKVGKHGVEGVLQFEYSVVAGEYGSVYWDLSDLDGAGSGLVGTPFFNDNVKVSPTGPGAGTGTCKQIRCKAGQTCVDSYQTPVDNNTKSCPVNTGDMWVDLCQPEAEFITRSTIASRHLSGHRHGHAKRHL